MFRFIRTLLYIAIAFWAGLQFERFIATDKCLDRGDRMIDGVCSGVP